MSPEELVFTAFTATNALQIVSYLPQIVAVVRDRNGASAIAYSSWVIWLAGSASTSAYAMINIWDVWLLIVNAVHAVCCLTVIVLTAWKRSQHSAPDASLASVRKNPPANRSRELVRAVTP
jgi:hypothetical protein